MKCKIAWVAALAAGFLAGCGAARPTNYYQLSVPGHPLAVADRSPYPVTLLLGPIRSSHLYREEHIVYGSSGEHMGTYENQQWAEPPTEMLEEMLLRELRDSGRYRAVDMMRSNSHGDYILYGRLYDFKELPGTPLSTRVTIDLELRDVKTATTVWTHYFTHDEPAGGKEISAVVAALDHNAQDAIADIRSGLERFFAAHPMN